MCLDTRLKARVISWSTMYSKAFTLLSTMDTFSKSGGLIPVTVYRIRIRIRIRIFICCTCTISILQIFYDTKVTRKKGQHKNKYSLGQAVPNIEQRKMTSSLLLHYQLCTCIARLQDTGHRCKHTK